MIQDAIKKHGAKAVYRAASLHMEDGVSLASVGLSAETMAGVWTIQSEAYGAMSEVEKAIDCAQAGAALDSRTRGRPPKPPGEGAESFLHIRVPTEDKARWVKQAQSEGKKLAEWVKERLG